MTTIISGSSPSITFSDSTTQSTTAPSTSTFGFKNRIINGAMVIDQRNAGASVTPTVDNTYTLDRWSTGLSQASKFSVQQNAGSVTPPVGFSNYLGVTSLAATSLSAGDYFNLKYTIEGFNTSDLMFGTANVKTVTLSFQVYSSLTGTFGGALQNGAQNRSYPFSYSIPVANTWTTISVTIAGDTTGTWVGATNGRGLSIWYGLGTGSTYSGTASAWAAGTYFAPPGATSVVGTNGATFYITGVQLEVGTQATSFDFRDYGRELILCQRYYETFYGSVGYSITMFQAISGSNVTGGGTFKVTKRASASIALIGNVYINGYNNSNAGAASISGFSSSVDSWGTILTGASGLTAGNASCIYSLNTSSGFVFSSEL